MMKSLLLTTATATALATASAEGVPRRVLATLSVDVENEDTGMTTTTPNDGRIYDGDARAMHERAERIGHPIGVPHPTTDATAGSTLDHAQEDRQRADANQPQAAALSTADKFKGIEVVELTPTPDEFVVEESTWIKDRKEEIVNAVPVVAPKGSSRYSPSIRARPRRVASPRSPPRRPASAAPHRPHQRFRSCHRR